MIERFLEYLTGPSYGYGGYKAAPDAAGPSATGKELSIAIVSEDETAYGEENNADGEDVNGNAESGDIPVSGGKVKTLYVHFPREISQFRAAYQKEVAGANGDGQSAPRDILPFNGDVSGEDSITAFSSGQRALSQEAVMQGLVVELKRHPVQFVIVRATDPMDTLFVSRYIRKTHPGVRVVTIGADMLFRREVEDPELHGLFSLSTYSMAPTASHGFVAYEESHLERVFPSSDALGTYNAMRSLTTAWADESSPERDDCRIELRSHSAQPFVKLYQYGWRLEETAPWCDRYAVFNYNAPPVRLLALGRDDYWPVANLGPYPKERPSSLPDVADQIEYGPEPIKLPYAWRAVQFVCSGLALAFCLMLWRSSVFSHSQAVATFAPACSDSRAMAIFVSGLALTLTTLILLWPFLHDVDRAVPDYVLGGFGMLVAGITVVELLTRGELSVMAAAERRAAAERASTADLAAVAARTAAAKRACYKCWLFVLLFVIVAAVVLHLALRDEPREASLALLRRFATLRATRLTSSLSFIMPISFFLSTCLWWSNSVVPGYALLDDRRPRLPRLPKGMENPILATLGKRIPDEFRSILEPSLKSYAKYLGLLAIVLVLSYLVDWRYLSLERPSLERITVLFLTLALASVIGLTMRLWETWVGVRRLLEALDSQPLRRGFSKIEGLSWQPIWRFGAGTMAEFQRVIAREWEALLCAANTVPDLAAEKQGLDRELECTRSDLGTADEGKRRFSVGWFKRRQAELRLVHQFGKYQELVGKAAGVALDYLAQRWLQEREDEDRLVNHEDLRVRACERFVCLVYVNFLLAMLTRIRTLIVAIGGMYVLILIGTSQYLFEPRAAIQLLLVVLFAYIATVVGVVFAQIHQDTILSRLTGTNPGELGSDFWVRMTSFVALPLISLFASQFPSLNRFFYSWIRPAIESLNH